jgi:hypothetical protein
MNPNSQDPSILALRCYTHVVDALQIRAFISSVARFFTLLEAEGLLPQVEGLLRTLIQLKQDHENADAELSGINQRIALSGGMILPREQVQQIRARRDASSSGLKTAVEKIQEIGCQLKDIEIGLVDFPTLYRGKEVYLCWKLGESGIGFWHHIEDGYRGRHPIDSEFLANHGAG